MNLSKPHPQSSKYRTPTAEEMADGIALRVVGIIPAPRIVATGEGVLAVLGVRVLYHIA